MRTLLVYICLIFNVSYIFSEDINLEIKSSIKKEGDVVLIIDGVETGKLPITIDNLSPGYHDFTLRWIDSNGNVVTRNDKILISSSDRRLYLSTTKTNFKPVNTFMLGLLGGMSGFFVAIFLTISLFGS